MLLHVEASIFIYLKTDLFIQTPLFSVGGVLCGPKIWEMPFPQEMRVHLTP